jgi:hypothetical protein
MEEIRIKVTSDDKALDSTTEKLKKMGTVTDENAKKFQEAGKKHTAALGDMGTETGRLERKFQNLGERIVAAFAIERIYEFTVEAVKAFADSEAAVLKLNAALGTQGGTTSQLKALLEQADKLEKTSIFSHKQVTEAQTAALQYGLTADVIRKKVIPAITDYASASRKDLGSALDDVLRGLEGNGRALKLYGVHVKQTGDQAFDLDNILGQLNGKFSGQATIIAGSTQGTLDKLGNSWEFIKEQVGGFIASLFTVPQAVLEVNAELDDINKKSSDKLKTLLNENLERQQKIMDKEGEYATYTTEQIFKILNTTQLEEGRIRAELLIRQTKEEKSRHEKIIAVKKEFARMSTEQLQIELEGDNKMRAKLAGEEINARKKHAEELKKIEDKEANERVKRIHEAIKGNAEYDKFLEDEAKKKQAIFDEEMKALKEFDDIQIQTQKELIAEEKKLKQKRLDELSDFVSSAVDQYTKLEEVNISSIDHQQERQKQAIDTQRSLAEKGFKNDLDFELKKQNDLEKARAKAQQQIKKAKELETFLNSVAKFSETDPKTALPKAIAQLALIKGAEALYMEKGGIIGRNNPLSRFDRRHPGGGDVLVHAQTGEGMFSRREVANMGGPDAFLDLKRSLSIPLSDRRMPVLAVSSSTGSRAMLNKLDSIEHALKNIKHTSVDYEGLNMVVTTMQNGIIDKIKYINKKPTL